MKLWNYWPPDVRSPEVAGIREIFLRFGVEHPEIEVETARSMTFIGGGAETGRFMAMASGTAPDVIAVSMRQLPGYIDQGMLIPLNRFAEHYEPWVEISREFIEAATVDGNLYAVPVILGMPEIHRSYGYIRQDWPQGGTLVLVYRKDMFADAGLDPERPPQTWEELYEYAKILRGKNVVAKSGPLRGYTLANVYGFGIATGQEAGFHFANFVWQNGGELVRKVDGRWKCVFDEREGVEALEFLQTLRWAPFTKDGQTFRGVAFPGFIQAQGTEDNLFLKFVGGEVAMFMDNPGRWQSMEHTPQWGLTAANVGLAPLPAGRAGRAHVIVPVCWAITTQSDDPKVHEAAWEYIKYLNSEETMRYHISRLVEQGLAGWNMDPAYLKRFGFLEEYEDIDEQYRTIGDKIKPSQRLEPPIPGWQHVSEVELSTALEKALTISPDVSAAEVLHEAARRANMLLMETRTRKERVPSNLLAGIVLALTVVFMLTIFRRLVRTILGRTPRAAGKPPQPKEQFAAWLYLLPAVLSVIVWGYVPLMRGLGIAFFDYKLFSENRFIWFDNFLNVFGQPLFWEVLGNTFQYVFLTLAMGFFVPLILAILLTEVPRGKYAYRILYYLPAVIAPVVVLLMWRGTVFDPTSWGVLNRALGWCAEVFNHSWTWCAAALAKVHIQLPDVELNSTPMVTWLNDPRLAMICVIIPGIWGGAGPASLIYIAALKSIPEEVYEAADLDRAGMLRKIRHITIPYLAPLVIINLVGAFVGAFQAAENIFVMTEGGPINATRTIGLEIFYNAFLYLKYGYATAMAWIMGSVLMGFTLINLRVIRRVEFTRAR